MIYKLLLGLRKGLEVPISVIEQVNLCNSTIWSHGVGWCGWALGTKTQL